MKPTDKQIQIIDSVISIVKTWKNTNDITSPTHYTDIEEFIDADLDELIPNSQIKCIVNELSRLFNRIQKNP